MKLVNSGYNLEIEFKENRIVYLIIEDRDSIRKIISDLWNQSKGAEGDFVLSEGNKELKFEKYFDIVINPFDINLNNKRIQSALFSSLEKNAENYLNQKERINGMIINLLDRVTETESLVCFDYSLELNWKDLFKLYNVGIDVNYLTTLEIILEYLKILSSFLDVKIIAFAGLNMFFSKSDLERIIIQANYCKVQLIFISPYEDYDTIESDIYIIDRDICMIRRTT